MLASDSAVESPIRHALEGFSAALDLLIKVADDGGLDDLDADELIGFAQDLERVRNRISLLDHRIIATATVRDIPGRLCQRSMTQVLTSSLRISDRGSAPAGPSRRPPGATPDDDRPTTRPVPAGDGGRAAAG